MAELIREGAANEKVRTLAGLLGNAQTIENFIRRVWRVKDDPWNVEYIVRPTRQIEEFIYRGFLEGDCDDSAVCAGALCAALGLRCFLIAIRLEGNPEFSHVWLRCGDVDIDPVVPLEMLPILDYAEAMIEPI